VKKLSVLAFDVPQHRHYMVILLDREGPEAALPDVTA